MSLEQDYPPPPTGPTATDSTTPSASRDEALARGELLLTVEDNPVNQKLTRHQLRLLGYVTDFADDGLQGLARWRQGHYRLVLTDLHMPIMDGYEMVRAMRREEAASGNPRTVVVALTANAMKGQAELCLAAGMDDYLAKPVSLSRLGGVLSHWLGRPSGNRQTADASRTEHEESSSLIDQAMSAVDVGVLAALVGNKPALLERFLTDYLRHGQTYQQSLLAALASGDLREAGALAHKLKSSSRSVGALALGELCERIESAGLAGQQVEVVALGPALASHWREVAAAIEAWLTSESMANEDTSR